MYSLVNFTKENSFQLIPTSWINREKTSSKWPPGPASTLIKDRAKPLVTWKDCKLTILKSTDDYLKGKKWERKAVNGEDLESTDFDKPRRRKRKCSPTPIKRKSSSKKLKQRTDPQSDSSSSHSRSQSRSISSTPEPEGNSGLNFDSNIFPEKDVFSALNETTTKENPFDSDIAVTLQLTSLNSAIVENTPNDDNNLSLSTATDNFRSSASSHKFRSPVSIPTDNVRSNSPADNIRSIFLADNVRSSTAVDSFLSSSLTNITPLRSAQNTGSLRSDLTNLSQRQSAFEKQVLRGIAEIKDDLSEILNRLPNHLTDSNELQLPVSFPLTDYSEVTCLENWIDESPKHRTELTIFLARFGGNDTAKITRKILKNIFNPDLARKINYTGGGPHEKFAFCKLNLNSIVFDAVRRNKKAAGATDADITTAIQNWFRNSRDLEGGRARTQHVSKKATKNSGRGRGISSSD